MLIVCFLYSLGQTWRGCTEEISITFTTAREASGLPRPALVCWMGYTSFTAAHICIGTVTLWSPLAYIVYMWCFHTFSIYSFRNGAKCALQSGKNIPLDSRMTWLDFWNFLKLLTSCQLESKRKLLDFGGRGSILMCLDFIPSEFVQNVWVYPSNV